MFDYTRDFQTAYLKLQYFIRDYFLPVSNNSSTF